MRVAVLCSDLGVRVPGHKGASLHLQQLTSALAQVGHDVLLVGIAGSSGTPDLPGQVKTLLLPHPGRAEGLERERRKLAMVEQLVLEAGPAIAGFGPDVIYERLALFGTAGQRLAEAAGVAHVVEVNALLAAEEATWRGLHLLDEATSRERSVLAGADLRVAVSDELAAQVAALSTGPTIALPNGVDTARFGLVHDRLASRRLLGLPVAASVVGFTGTLRPWHGLDRAIRALALTRGSPILAVAGDGEVRPELERLAAQLGVADRVRWFGQLPHAAIPGFLAACDLLSAPYPRTADFTYSPLKLLEYLASGVPVVASDIGQIRTLLDGGRFGTLVPAGDVAALASAFDELARHPAVSLARAAAARRHAIAEHGWDSRARELSSYLEGACRALAQ